MRICIVLGSLCVAAILQADEPAKPVPVVLESIKAKYTADVGRAYEARLKAYKDRLVEVTKAGDFVKAQGVQARIDQLERLQPEPEMAAKAPKRPRPKDTTRFQGHAFAIIREEATWHVAKQRCEEMGGHLACCENPAKEAFLKDLCHRSGANVWIGCSRETDEIWRWLNGEVANLPGAAIDNAGKVEFHMNWMESIKNWNDAPAGWKLSYACEWDR